VVAFSPAAVLKVLPAFDPCPYRGLSKTKLAKRYGMKKAADFVNWLQSIGKADLLQPGVAATPCQFVPFEFVAELDCLWAQRQGSRQRLLGE